MKPAWAKALDIKGEKGTLLLLYIQPGASKTEIRGTYAERLKISVKSPPVDGAANHAIIEFLALSFKIAKSRIHLLSGATSRQKNFWIASLSDLEFDRLKANS